MPELPEVEVTRLGITPHIADQTIDDIIIRNPNMRWPIPSEVLLAKGLVIQGVERRAKYLLIATELGSIILHLGMSGSLSVVPTDSEIKKHDHFELVLANGISLRLNDPRRFGAVLWQAVGQQAIDLLSHLGPEPLTEAFNDTRLYDMSRKKKTAVKTFIMDNKVVVGVGNIYANEALFMAGIHPKRAADNISLARYQKLTQCIKTVLAKAIEQGGTTLKDFTKADGKPGYFAQSLNVYGRAGLPCVSCQRELVEIRLGQRATVFCKHCQT
ncbi:bifunctional DNA-formamidopyrimidine glycosylase/DNA-(apurinic or apyrimidinic site) lyase [Catenovulum sp. SM1970]|uniref:bifunctional DNA-formamidopyrimidine glycosylase/DNA-(apurinic or apyrimidinic site) lyase n=1 Tax=Marinifaba aquimaris TaxID=2741323 RepID=UPI001573C1C4|nr:bifunctional DNA-formamidopyrimidine glycosylase/DNA-(apurinic or apyrimidinic site) lyase [Marinifaba aquimaris]NTS75701.1 bifunctional DNA-formamidopyrimidine glycosylase/DNA-(apurinic or apyrimidinic site) lyase [Marinifaba aquimaris]